MIMLKKNILAKIILFTMIAYTYYYYYIIIIIFIVVVVIIIMDLNFSVGITNLCKSWTIDAWLTNLSISWRFPVYIDMI